jgi:hypothetical protein
LEDESQDVDRSRDRSRDQIKESKLERAMRKEREALERDYNEDRMLIQYKKQFPEDEGGKRKFASAFKAITEMAI